MNAVSNCCVEEGDASFKAAANAKEVNEFQEGHIKVLLYANQTALGSCL